MRESEKLAQEAGRIASLASEAEEGSQRARQEIAERRGALNAEALSAIQSLLDRRPHTAESAEEVASLLRAIGLSVGEAPEPGPQHFAIVVVCEDESPEAARQSVARMLGRAESVHYVGPACALGESHGGEYVTTEICLATGDRRGRLIAAPGKEPTSAEGPVHRITID